MTYVGNSKTAGLDFGQLTFSATGNGILVDFTLPESPGADGAIDVWVGNVFQSYDAYYTNGTMLTFTEAPADGAPIYVKYRGKGFGIDVSSDVISDGDFKKGITLDKLASGTAGNVIRYVNGVATSRPEEELADPNDRKEIFLNSKMIAENAGFAVHQTVDGITDSYTFSDGVVNLENWVSSDYDRVSQSAWLDGTADNRTKTYGGAGDQTKWIMSAWIQRTEFSIDSYFLTADTTSRSIIGFDSSNRLHFNNHTGAADRLRVSSRVFRDTEWLHVLISWDTDAAYVGDAKLEIYVNNEAITAFDTSTGVIGDADTGKILGTAIHHLGGNSTETFAGFISQFSIMDGVSLQAGDYSTTDFGESIIVGSKTIEWVPKTDASVVAVATAAGGNSVCMTSAIGDGTDASTNANNFTAAGGSMDHATNGSDNSPSNTLSIFNIIHPTDSGFAYADKIRTITSSGTGGFAVTTIPFDVERNFYCEFDCSTMSGSSANMGVGIISVDAYNIGDLPAVSANAYGYNTDGTLRNNNSTSAYGNSWIATDVIGIHVSGGTLVFEKNGAGQGNAVTGLTGKWFIVLWDDSANTLAGTFYFDVVEWTQASPSGTLPIDTKHATSSPENQGFGWFNTVTYTGTGASLANSDVGFEPALVWIKNRETGTTDSHQIYDFIRGSQQSLSSDVDAIETTVAQGLTSFDVSGFTVGTDVAHNTVSENYVAWCWKAGETSEANTDGTINTTISVAKPGHFSIVRMLSADATGANATLGHGLGGTPELIIGKRTSSATQSWPVYSEYLIAGDTLYLDTNALTTTSATTWNSGSGINSTVFPVGSSNDTNNSSSDYVFYCFRSVDGVCKVGSYTGNGAVDGPFVHLGFKPRFILIKRTDVAGSWFMYDTARSIFNEIDDQLLAEINTAETTGSEELDFLGTGFKIRAVDAQINATGGDYIYLAMADFAEQKDRHLIESGSEMTLISMAQTASSQPNKGWMVIEHEAIDSVIVNTDVKAWMTRDDGQTVTTNFAVNSKFSLSSHPFVAGDRVILTSTGNLPAGSSATTLYYIVNTAANDFELSLTSGGATITLTGDGTGTHEVVQFEQGTLEEANNVYDDLKILSAYVDFSNLPIGTSVRYLVETLNNKGQAILSASMQWG